MKLIGLAGKAGAGKDYVAGLFDDFEPSSVQYCYFAGPLKRMIHEVFGIPLTDMWTKEGKDKLTWAKWEDFYHCDNMHGYLTTRQLMQFIGTDVMRDSFMQDIWVKCAEQRIKKWELQDEPSSDYFIIPDCRFENEATMIRAHKGQVWEVRGRAYDNTPAHASEAGIEKPDYVIHNPVGTMDEELFTQIKAGLSSWS